MEEKNYYDWLEINRNASPEVIEKAYKALVKKYHPDLQEGDNKVKAEEILKKINEAYDVLSDETKKQRYDETLKENTVSKEDYDRLQQELNNMRRQSANNKYNGNYNQSNNINNSTNNVNSSINNNVNNVNNNYYTPSQEQIREEQNREYQQQIENARKKAYYDAYVQDMKRRGYKIRYKKTWKDYLNLLIAIFAVIFVCVLIWVIPFTREKIIDIYNSNELIKGMVDPIIYTFKAIF